MKSRLIVTLLLWCMTVFAIGLAESSSAYAVPNWWIVNHGWLRPNESRTIVGDGSRRWAAPGRPTIACNMTYNGLLIGIAIDRYTSATYGTCTISTTPTECKIGSITTLNVVPPKWRSVLVRRRSGSFFDLIEETETEMRLEGPRCGGPLSQTLRENYEVEDRGATDGTIYPGDQKIEGETGETFELSGNEEYNLEEGGTVELKEESNWSAGGTRWLIEGEAIGQTIELGGSLETVQLNSQVGGAKVMISCIKNSVAGEIEQEGKSAGEITLESCKPYEIKAGALEPLGSCAVEVPIKFKFRDQLIHGAGGLPEDEFKPSFGTNFVTIKITGSLCVLKGSYEVAGTYIASLGDGGEVSMPEHRLAFTSTGSKLTLGSERSTLTMVMPLKI
jgi:hypothetical protein